MTVSGYDLLSQLMKAHPSDYIQKILRQLMDIFAT